jgi:glycolate oxidase FAD binding subunit
MPSPASIPELCDLVNDLPVVLPVGGGTKERLSLVEDDVEKIKMSALSGITEYEPSEYTFTALAGTPVKEIQQALHAKGQFLPFAPPLRDAGATLGGVTASGISGAGRFRFGGLRDFILGIQFVDGTGTPIRSGGKVVKNAAGFDLSKLMVGSLGRLGILAELTFKVFPQAAASVSLRIRCPDHQDAAQRLSQAGLSRWEPEALDYDPGQRSITLRLAGPRDAIGAVAADITRTWPGEVATLDEADGLRFWETLREMRDLPAKGAAVKVPLTPRLIPLIQSGLDELEHTSAHYSAGGAVAIITTQNTEQLAPLEHLLQSHRLSGLTFKGKAQSPLWLNPPPPSEIHQAIKRALDPQSKFPPF